MLLWKDRVSIRKNHDLEPNVSLLHFPPSRLLLGIANFENSSIISVRSLQLVPLQLILTTQRVRGGCAT